MRGFFIWPILALNDTLKKSLLHIDEDLELNMTLEEFEAWQKRNVSDRTFSFRTFSYFYWGELELHKAIVDDSLLVKRESLYLTAERCEIYIELFGKDKRVKVKTMFPGAPWIFVLGFLLLTMVIMISILPEWVRSELSSKSFDLFSKSIVVPLFIIVFALIIQIIVVRFQVKKIHRLIKESLLRK